MVICSKVFIEFGAFCVNVSLGMPNGSFMIVHSQTVGFSLAHILGLTIVKYNSEGQLLQGMVICCKVLEHFALMSVLACGTAVL